MKEVSQLSEQAKVDEFNEFKDLLKLIDENIPSFARRYGLAEQTCYTWKKRGLPSWIMQTTRDWIDSKRLYDINSILKSVSNEVS